MARHGLPGTVGLVGDLLVGVASFATELVARAGYAGVFALMTAEAVFFPLPSEAVLPPAGILVAEGRLSFPIVLAVATAGSLLGSLAWYWVGLAGGQAYIRRHRRWFMMHERDFDRAEDFFRRRGVVAVFLARFVPGIRHVSSLPAGVARMPLVPFCLATVAGTGLWNATLLWAGFALGENWEAVLGLLRYAEVAAAVLLAAAVATWIWRRRRRETAPSG